MRTLNEVELLKIGRKLSERLKEKRGKSNQNTGAELLCFLRESPDEVIRLIKPLLAKLWGEKPDESDCLGVIDDLKKIFDGILLD